MSESGEIFNLGDLVWAKMKGFPPWPGRISEPSLDLKKPAGKKSLHCIYFFGSKNYGWIEECHLKDYAKYKDELTKANKSQAFRDAVNAIENYVDNSKEGIVNGTDDVDDIFEKVKNSVSEFSTPKPKRKLIKREITPSSPASVTNTNSSSSSNSEIKPSPVKRAKLENIIRRDNFPGLRMNADVDRPSQILANHMSLIASRPYEALFSRNLSEPPQENLLSVDLATVSPALKEKNITPSRLLFGFLGLGNMGTGILKNILNSGHRVIIWNRTSDKCDDFVRIGAEVGMTPSDVVQAADITFSCLSDAATTTEMVFGNCGVLTEMTPTKAYVELTTIDDHTSALIADAVAMKGGRYLEAQIQGCKAEADLGTLVIIAAGDKILFNDCQSCFLAMSKNAFYLGEIGNATKMNGVLQMIRGIILAGVAESCALADRLGLQHKDILEILQLTSIACPAIMDNIQFLEHGAYRQHTGLPRLQNNMKMVLKLGDQVEQPLPITATTYETFKAARRAGYGLASYGRPA